MPDAGKPLTTGWKVAIVAALLIALGNTGVGALRSQEEQHFRNHEKRIDDLENQVRELRSTVDSLRQKAKAD